MWICATCKEEIEDQFDACWNCGRGIEEEPDETFLTRASPAIPSPVISEKSRKRMSESRPLRIANGPYAWGGIVDKLLLSVGPAILAGYPWPQPWDEDRIASTGILAIVSLVAAFFCLRSMMNLPLSVEIGRRLKFNALLRSLQFDFDDLEDIEYEVEARFFIPLIPLFVVTLGYKFGERRFVRFWMKSGKCFRILVDQKTEYALRDFIGRK